MGRRKRDPYPRLTPLRDYPLHGWSYGGIEYACRLKHPEEVEHQAYDWRCPDCVALADAWIKDHGDKGVVYRRDAGSEEEVVLLSWLVARSRYWLPRTANLYDGD